MRPIIGFSLFVLGIALCGAVARAENVPMCSDKAVESTVKTVLLESELKQLRAQVTVETIDFLAAVDADGGFLIANARKPFTSAHIILNKQEYMGAFSFEFSNERSREYQPEILKRWCVADIAASIDENKVISSIDKLNEIKQWSDLDYKRSIQTGELSNLITSNLKQQVIDRLLNAGQRFSDAWNQNYSVQVTDSGNVYVTVGE